MKEDREPVGESPLDGVLAEALRSLPREAEASALLEERTVRSLQQRGLLARRRRGLPPSWWVAGAAASLALFASGVIAGQWLSARNTALTVAAQQASLEEIASVLEQTGAGYVSALAHLAERDLTQSDANAAREVAVQILHRAANEVVRLAPNDPVAVKILQGFDHPAEQQSVDDPRTRRRKIVWY